MDPQNLKELVEVLKDQAFFEQLIARTMFHASIGLGFCSFLVLMSLFGTVMAWRCTKDDENAWLGVGIGVVAATIFTMLLLLEPVTTLLYPEAATIAELLR
jgi:hypothetical protein